MADLRGRARELPDSTEATPSWRERVAAETILAAVSAIEAYEQWRSGDPAGALPALERARRRINGVQIEFQAAGEVVRHWNAAILSELGRHREAAPLWESLRWSPLAFSRAALAWEAAGETERAHAAWARALTAWRHADPGFPLLAEARAGFERTSPDR